MVLQAGSDTVNAELSVQQKRKQARGPRRASSLYGKANEREKLTQSMLVAELWVDIVRLSDSKVGICMTRAVSRLVSGPETVAMCSNGGESMKQNAEAKSYVGDVGRCEFGEGGCSDGV